MNKFKKALCLFLSLVMLMSVCSVSFSVFAYETVVKESDGTKTYVCAYYRNVVDEKNAMHYCSTTFERITEVSDIFKDDPTRDEVLDMSDKTLLGQEDIKDIYPVRVSYKCKECLYSSMAYPNCSFEVVNDPNLVLYKVSEIKNAEATAEHICVKTNVEASCVNDGSTTYKCLDAHCKFERTFLTTAGKPEFHKVIFYDKPATCISKGEKYSYCGLCGETFGPIVYTDKTNTHNWEVFKSSSNCKEYGKTIYTCKDCGQSYFETNFEGGYGPHNFVTVQDYEEPTCTIKGKMGIRRCSRCNEFEYIIERVPQTITVGEGDKQVTVSKTDENGNIIYNEKVLTASEKEKEYGKVTTINANGHQWENGRCKVCNTAQIGTDDKGNAVLCSCVCHSQGGIGRLIGALVVKVYELLGVREYCNCGHRHYDKNKEKPKLDIGTIIEGVLS